jgi:hypothetical protein
VSEYGTGPPEQPNPTKWFALAVLLDLGLKVSYIKYRTESVVYRTATGAISPAVITGNLRTGNLREDPKHKKQALTKNSWRRSRGPVNHNPERSRTFSTIGPALKGFN